MWREGSAEDSVRMEVSRGVDMFCLLIYVLHTAVNSAGV